MLVIGHRGAAGHKPENTLSSFQKALELGVDMVEFDVYVCRSGEVVVIHDDRLERTTNGSGYVVEKNFQELRQLDAGDSEKIPLLEEVLDLCAGKTKVNIELKGLHTAEAVWLVLEKYLKQGKFQEEDFLISSFDHFELKKFQNFNPQIKLGALLEGIPLSLAQFGEDVGAYSVNLSLDFVNKEIIDDAHKRGLKVFVWTVNHPEDFRKMKNLGVDGVFSDYPERMK